MDRISHALLLSTLFVATVIGCASGTDSARRLAADQAATMTLSEFIQARVSAEPLLHTVYKPATTPARVADGYYETRPEIPRTSGRLAKATQRVQFLVGFYCEQRNGVFSSDHVHFFELRPDDTSAVHTENGSVCRGQQGQSLGAMGRSASGQIYLYNSATHENAQTTAKRRAAEKSALQEERAITRNRQWNAATARLRKNPKIGERVQVHVPATLNRAGFVAHGLIVDRREQLVQVQFDDIEPRVSWVHIEQLVAPPPR